MAQRRGNELAAVDHRAAADGQDEIAVVAPGLRHGPQQGVELRIGFDAGEAADGEARQCLLDLGPDAVLEDAAATVGDQHAAAGGNFLAELGDLAFAEMDLGRIMKTEITHGRLRQAGFSLSADYSATASSKPV